jgi:PTH1 family peptidyl-tRNA hydrolase
MKPSLIIIGLGNPGKSYERTRHNAGFLALDALSADCGSGQWSDQQKFLSIVQEAHVGVVPAFLVKPQTYMNLSGDAIRKLVNFYKLKHEEQILVVCDDVDLPLGTVRLRKGGSPGTHNGLKSVATHYGENFARLRIGIGPKPEGADLSAWVLSTFSEEEEKTLQKTLEQLPAMVRDFVMQAERGESEKEE